MGRSQFYILSIDAGTTGITVLAIDHGGKIIQRGYQEIKQFYPEPGWVEHDPIEIWDTTRKLIGDIFQALDAKYCEAIGITNQRETTVVWDRDSGQPIHRAIVWQCRRTFDFCESLKSQGLGEVVHEKTGLFIDSYFSATKIRWILDHVSGARNSAGSGKLAFGTIDTWLIYQLTGGKCHKTDQTNASRTMLYNIHSKAWDDELLQIFDIPGPLLPQVLSSSSQFGQTDRELFGRTIPITGVAGDQQAALFGQLGFKRGAVKSTYGTGCFLLANTGEKAVQSSTGLITTIACGKAGEPVYALEGSVFMGGAIVQWLRDGLNLLKHASDSEKLATTVSDSGGVVIVPAFTGLGAPYWRSDVKGAIFGLTRGTNKNHLIRAALESIASQVYDMVEAIRSELDFPLLELCVDGGAAQNDFLMQFQADILNIPINRPKYIETTALGAGYLAGLGAGFWSSAEALSQCRQTDKIFHPRMKADERSAHISRWKHAVSSLLGEPKPL
ncbi:MAG: glycerol kinase GlpK [Candidatus Marinimicrobia bacterium]|nr:glycerol kinase GlpK [Candidatus Neomarinimicrobiota bacterium]